MSISIPLNNLARLHATLEPEIHEAAHRVIRSGRYILGDEVERFEAAWASFVGVKHCIGCANGTDALVLILQALGVGAGDEVITVSHTFIATVEAICRVGATPVLVDARLEDALIDPDQVADAMSPRTRALIGVHLYGSPVDTARLLAILDPRDIPLIEDAAQAHGAAVRGEMVGSLGLAAAFSFYPGKTLGALGDAGAITTDDDAIAARIRSIRDHGRTSRFVHERFAGNSRLDELQAAILSVKLPHLPGWVRARQRIISRYRAALRSHPEIRLFTERSDAAHGAHLFVICSTARDALRAKLLERGIETGLHYPLPCHRQPAWLSRFGVCTLPRSEQLAATCLSLPLDPLLTEDEVDLVLQALDH